MHFEVYTKSILLYNRNILCYNQLEYVFLLMQILANDSLSKLITWRLKEMGFVIDGYTFSEFLTLYNQNSQNFWVRVWN